MLGSICFFWNSHGILRQLPTVLLQCRDLCFLHSVPVPWKIHLLYFVSVTCLFSVIANACISGGFNTFGDPCPNVPKNFVAQVLCSAPATATRACAGPIGEEATVNLACPLSTQTITSIAFASFGTATGILAAISCFPSSPSAIISLFSRYLTILDRLVRKFPIGKLQRR